MLTQATASLVWDFKPSVFDKDAKFPSTRPLAQLNHDCQTVRTSGHPILIYFDVSFIIPQGRWLTILKAQWSPNTDAFPHFTVSRFLKWTFSYAY